MVEIERLVSGDLNKSIEQCVTLLMDVERKVHVLKNELAQTLNQLPNARTGGFAGLPTQFPVSPGFAPQFASPYPASPTPGGIPEASMPRSMPTFAPFWQGWNPGWTSGAPWTYGYNTAPTLPYGYAPGHQGIPLPSFGVPFGVPYQSLGGHGVPSVPGFSPLHQGIAPVPGYGYIW